MPAKRPDSETIALGRVVRELRRARGWSQAELAEAISAKTRPPWTVDQVMVARIERGARVTPPRDRQAIADTLGVDVAVLSVDGDPFAYSEMDAWRDRATLDAASDGLRRAAEAFAECCAAFGEGDDKSIERQARKIVRDAVVTGWNREMERQNG